MNGRVSLRIAPRRRGGFYVFAEDGSFDAQRTAIYRLRAMLRDRGIPAESYVVTPPRPRRGSAREGLAVVAPLATPGDLPVISTTAAEVLEA